MSSALVVQCFIKPDTLAGLCQSLLACEGGRDIHLIFWSDTPAPGRNFERNQRLNAEVRALAEAFIRTHGGKFASATLHTNNANRGTCGTCQAALDHAFSLHDFVIFTEDDTVFARDALLWFAALRDGGQLDEPDVIALAGESIYFDSRTAKLPPGYAAQARKAAAERDLASMFVRLNFVPSTCFATTREKWARFGAVRGQPRGDEDVCTLCREQNLHCVFPVVARVKDIGMLHADGYSVGVLGADGVREIKNTYLMADELPPRATPPRLYGGSLGRLFEESVKLTGFDALPSAPPVHTSGRAWQLWCFSLRNFGDALTPYILSKYGVQFELVEDFANANLLGIGSNLDRVRRDNTPIVIWSAGFMYCKAKPVAYGPDVRFLGVRGQLTQAAIEPVRRGELAIGDGGLLAARIFDHAAVAKTYELGIIPHMSDVRAARAFGIANWPGVKVIDILAPLENVMQDIASCRRIASSSLHGIVTADAFGIPSCYALFQGGRDVEGEGFKYDDYASALGYEIAPILLGPSTTRDQLLAAIDAQPARPLPSPALLDDLEMTLQVLKAGARGLCTI